MELARRHPPESRNSRHSLALELLPNAAGPLLALEVIVHRQFTSAGNALTGY